MHVVDKATKLQTIYDRIDLVDTRFEVLKRDARLAALRAQMALRPVVDAGAEAVAESSLQRELQAIDADREFLRRCNQGAESMQEADQLRVRMIGTQRQWRNVEGAHTAFHGRGDGESHHSCRHTLTQAERDTINYHIVATIKMLETLPRPRHLKNVPEYAGGTMSAWTARATRAASHASRCRCRRA